jgi:hypothetical protein
VTERLPEPAHSPGLVAPRDPEELERKNLIWGLALFALVLLIFGATILVAYVYLALS